ncbi:substrate-binding domain-containing protein [Streptomyces sp. NPDC004752]
MRGHVSCTACPPPSLRSVGFVDGPASPRLRSRLDAVTEAWHVYGKADPEILTVRARSLSSVAGREAGQALLDGPCRPTAIVCADVGLAQRVLQALYPAGLRVPDEVAVVAAATSGTSCMSLDPSTRFR